MSSSIAPDSSSRQGRSAAPDRPRRNPDSPGCRGSFFSSCRPSWREPGFAGARHASRGHQLNQASPNLPLGRDRGNLSIWFHSRSLSVHARLLSLGRSMRLNNQKSDPGVHVVFAPFCLISQGSQHGPLTPLFAFLREQARLFTISVWRRTSPPSMLRRGDQVDRGACRPVNGH